MMHPVEMVKVLPIKKLFLATVSGSERDIFHPDSPVNAWVLLEKIEVAFCSGFLQNQS